MMRQSVRVPDSPDSLLLRATASWKRNTSLSSRTLAGACAKVQRLWGIVCDNKKQVYIYTVRRESDVKVDATVKLAL